MFFKIILHWWKKLTFSDEYNPEKYQLVDVYGKKYKNLESPNPEITVIATPEKVAAFRETNALDSDFEFSSVTYYAPTNRSQVLTEKEWQEIQEKSERFRLKPSETKAAEIKALWASGADISKIVETFKEKKGYGERVIKLHTSIFNQQNP